MAGAEGSAASKDGAPEARATFVEGDLVVYPNHGAGCVAGIEEKTILGEARRYYVVYLPDTELTLSIPADEASDLRPCADEEGVARALVVLGADATAMPSNWNHRTKHNREKIRGGEISEVAEVVRNLSVYDADNGLSTGERNMLMKARRILASEIALVRGIEIAEAEKLVDGALRGGTGGDAK
jgi:CarD family transcriptional regulator